MGKISSEKIGSTELAFAGKEFKNPKALYTEIALDFKSSKSISFSNIRAELTTKFPSWNTIGMGPNDYFSMNIRITASMEALKATNPPNVWVRLLAELEKAFGKIEVKEADPVVWIGFPELPIKAAAIAQANHLLVRQILLKY